MKFNTNRKTMLCFDISMAKFYRYIQFEQTLSELLKKVSLRKLNNFVFYKF